MFRGNLENRLDPKFIVLGSHQATSIKTVTLGSLTSQEPNYGTSSRAIPMKNEDEVKYIRITDFGDDGIEPNHSFTTVEDANQLDERYFLQEGDILFARSGSVGKTYIHTKDIGTAVFAGYCIRFRFDSSKVLPEFVYFYTKTSRFMAWVQSMQRSAVQPNINREELKSFTIPCPPIDIQNKLVTQLHTAREQRRRKLAEADALLSTMDEWMLGKLGISLVEDDRTVFAIRRHETVSRFDTGFFLPKFQRILAAIKSISHVTLDTLVSFSNETWDIEKAIADGQENFQYIEISGVNRETGIVSTNECPVIEAPSRARMVVHSGDIIISLTRPHHGSIAQIDESLDGCIASTGFAVTRVKDNQVVLDEYLWAILRCQISLQQMVQRSSGGNYPAITETELAQIIVPLPKYQTQQEIALEIIDRRIAVQRLRAEAEAEWQAAKLHFEEQLLSGGIS